MSHYLHGETAAAFSQRRPISWRLLFEGINKRLHGWITRQQQRQELLDYLSIDHRAAADLGISANDARDWAERPFWRD